MINSDPCGHGQGQTKLVVRTVHECTKIQTCDKTLDDPVIQNESPQIQGIPCTRRVSARPEKDRTTVGRCAVDLKRTQLQHALSRLWAFCICPAQRFPIPLYNAISAQVLEKASKSRVFKPPANKCLSIANFLEVFLGFLEVHHPQKPHVEKDWQANKIGMVAKIESINPELRRKHGIP